MGFETLMERRASTASRGRDFLHKGQGKTMSSVVKKPQLEQDHEPEFVTLQGPYIEPTYFDNWRNTNKSKWVAKNDFRRTGLKFATKIADNDFLEKGPYMEASERMALREENKAKWVADSTFRRHC